MLAFAATACCTSGIRLFAAPLLSVRASWLLSRTRSASPAAVAAYPMAAPGGGGFGAGVLWGPDRIQRLVSPALFTTYLWACSRSSSVSSHISTPMGSSPPGWSARYVERPHSMIRFLGNRFRHDHAGDEHPDLAGLRRWARNQVALQHDPAITAAWPPGEVAARRTLAERIRASERRREWKRVRAAAEAEDLALRTQRVIDKTDTADRLIARRALATQRRMPLRMYGWPRCIGTAHGRWSRSVALSSPACCGARRMCSTTSLLAASLIRCTGSATWWS